MKKLLLILCYFITIGAKKTDEQLVLQPTAQEVLEQYCSSDTIDHSFFAPDQGKIYKNIIRGLIQETAPEGSISLAAFRFTDKDVAADLKEAHKKGVRVEAVFDSGAVTESFYSQVFSLCEAGIAAYQYRPVGLLPPSQRSEEPTRIAYQAIMHQKTIVFQNTCGGKNIVVTGSLNFTTAGFYGNEEAVHVRNKPELVTLFLEHFEKLKQRSYAIQLHKAAESIPVAAAAQIVLRVVRYVR